MLHRLLPVLAIFSILLGILSMVAFPSFNPAPAPLTLRNIYSNVAYKILHRTSENDEQWYVDDVIRQALSGPTQTSEQAYFDNNPVKPQAQVNSSELLAQVLPASTNGGEKWIEVDLSDQKLYAHEGDQIVYTMLVSSGKPWTPTPTGEFRIWIKVKEQTMKGGSKETGDYYNLPHVRNVMYFYKGYGLHAAYWHNNFGHPMSHGCVNLSEADAAKLYNWAGPVVPEGQSWFRPTADNPGTRVVIHQ